ncbi:MAG: hypothetical protein CL728_04895 [Chloroflexi bacterium]|nr:hypothetical protein [Chloroflexota bacterium]|tara:strand:- start:625 stop:1506 length:882 start_codon:yes stop_codon:yes gene_type:complete
MSKPTLNIFKGSGELAKNKKLSSKSLKVTDAKLYLISCYDSNGPSSCSKNPQSKIRREEFLRSAKGLNVHQPGYMYKHNFTKEELLKRKLVAPKLDSRYEAMKLGEFGNLLSHAQIWHKFLETDDPYCIVMEDDVVIRRGFAKKLQSLLDDLNKKNKPWDVIWLQNSCYDSMTKSWYQAMHNKPSSLTFSKSNIVSNVIPGNPIYKVKNSFIGATAAYVINRKSAKYLLKNVFPMGKKPTNVFMQTEIPKSHVHLSAPCAERVYHKKYKEDTLKGAFVYSETDVMGSQIQTGP